jgi:hydroxyethylthiazole kinase-like uncharacterized protein yjeF
MKLLSPQQIHEWDAYTILNEPVASIELMERAAQKCTDFLLEQHLTIQPVKIFCGKGNNGGDGLAIARQLLEAGISPSIYILEFGAKGTDDFQTNLHRLHQLTSDIFFIQSEEFFPALDKNDLLIDALFGSGLNRPLQQLSKQIVDHINRSGAPVISIDVPSGMFIDKSSKGNAVITATYTLTFQSLKLCFLVAENAANFGNIIVLDIGLHPGFLKDVETNFHLVTKQQVSEYLQRRKAFSHKGNFGHALLVAGSKGKTGASLLAVKACLCSGAGLVTLNLPEIFLNALHSSIPEAMSQIREEGLCFKNINAVGIGPGLGTDENASQLVSETLDQFSHPIVLDADALNIIAHNNDWLSKIPAGSIITPHPKEFERLFGPSENDFSRMQLALQLSLQYPFTIVLKGHYTFIANEGKGWFNTTGNAGMAKGGSGDVLTGILTALLAQNYSSLSAAILGVFLHGLAADIAAQSVALESMLASDIIDHISDAFLFLQQPPDESNIN